MNERLTETKEASRDQAESVFSKVMRRVLRSEPSVLAAVVIDGEGECVDYCSRLDPFDAKVAAAHYQVVLMDAVARLLRFGGEVWELETVAEQRTILARRLHHLYSIVVLHEAGAVSETVRRALDRAGVAFRREADLETPGFELRVPRVEVRVRSSAGWPYAPTAFLPKGGQRWIPLQVVLGRWRNKSDELLCFRVRTMNGDEVTLAHDDEIDRWEVLDDETVNLPVLVGEGMLDVAALEDAKGH